MSHVTYVRKGDRILAFEAKRLQVRTYGVGCRGEWVCIVIEGPAGVADSPKETIERVFDDHNHQVLTITPRKKGAVTTFADVQRAVRRFVRDWRQGAKACTCEPIGDHP